ALLRVVLLRGAAVRGRRLGAARCPRALLRPVVGRVEAGALEVHRHRVEDALDGGVAGGAVGERILAHTLHHLKGVAPLAAILVDRHGTLSIGVLTTPEPALERAKRPPGPPLRPVGGVLRGRPGGRPSWSARQASAPNDWSLATAPSAQR